MISTSVVNSWNLLEKYGNTLLARIKNCLQTNAHKHSVFFNNIPSFFQNSGKLQYFKSSVSNKLSGSIKSPLLIKDVRECGGKVNHNEPIKLLKFRAIMVVDKIKKQCTQRLVELTTMATSSFGTSNKSLP